MSQGKTSSSKGKKSLGLRISCRGNKRPHPMGQKEYLSLLSQGGNRVQNEQTRLAMVSALQSGKGNPDTVKFVMSVSRL